MHVGHLYFNGCTCFEDCHYNSHCLSAVVLIGDASVGKTSLMRRFVDDEFRLNTMPTIGVDFVSRKLYIGQDVIRVIICDTGRYCITWSLAHIGVIMSMCACVYYSSFYIITLIVVIDTLLCNIVRIIVDMQS